VAARARAPERPTPPPPALPVAPTWIDDPDRFSLAAFYRIRARERRR
jgi:hypothetical protein